MEEVYGIALPNLAQALAIQVRNAPTHGGERGVIARNFKEIKSSVPRRVAELLQLQLFLPKYQIGHHEARDLSSTFVRLCSTRCST